MVAFKRIPAVVILLNIYERAKIKTGRLKEYMLNYHSTYANAGYDIFEEEDNE